MCQHARTLRSMCACVEVRGQTQVLLLRNMVHLLQIQPLESTPPTSTDPSQLRAELEPTPVPRVPKTEAGDSRNPVPQSQALLSEHGLPHFHNSTGGGVGRGRLSHSCVATPGRLRGPSKASACEEMASCTPPRCKPTPGWGSAPFGPYCGSLWLLVPNP